VATRRRFLKYAGSAAAVVGATALGFDYVLKSQFSVSNRMTSTLNATSSTTISSLTEVETRQSATQTSITQTGPVLVWESDFRDGTLDGFEQAVLDRSVGCSDFPIQPSDVLARIVDDSNAPSGHNKALELVANANNRSGLFVDGIFFEILNAKKTCRYQINAGRCSFLIGCSSITEY
jgi:hypothetical protein